LTTINAANQQKDMTFSSTIAESLLQNTGISGRGSIVSKTNDDYYSTSTITSATIPHSNRHSTVSSTRHSLSNTPSSHRTSTSGKNRDHQHDQHHQHHQNPLRESYDDDDDDSDDLLSVKIRATLTATTTTRDSVGRVTACTTCQYSCQCTNTSGSEDVSTDDLRHKADDMIKKLTHLAFDDLKLKRGGSSSSHSLKRCASRSSSLSERRDISRHQSLQNIYQQHHSEHDRSRNPSRQNSTININIISRQSSQPESRQLSRSQSLKASINTIVLSDELFHGNKDSNNHSGNNESNLLDIPNRSIDDHSDGGSSIIQSSVGSHGSTEHIQLPSRDMKEMCLSAPCLFDTAPMFTTTESPAAHNACINDDVAESNHKNKENGNDSTQHTGVGDHFHGGKSENDLVGDLPREVSRSHNTLQPQCLGSGSDSGPSCKKPSSVKVDIKTMASYTIERCSSPSTILFSLPKSKGVTGSTGKFGLVKN
jgi:hypothetical protein